MTTDTQKEIVGQPDGRRREDDEVSNTEGS